MLGPAHSHSQSHVHSVSHSSAEAHTHRHAHLVQCIEVLLLRLKHMRILHLQVLHVVLVGLHLALHLLRIHLLKLLGLAHHLLRRHRVRDLDVLRTAHEVRVRRKRLRKLVNGLGSDYWLAALTDQLARMHHVIRVWVGSMVKFGLCRVHKII